MAGCNGVCGGQQNCKGCGHERRVHSRHECGERSCSCKKTYTEIGRDERDKREGRDA